MLQVCAFLVNHLPDIYKNISVGKRPPLSLTSQKLAIYNLGLITREDARLFCSHVFHQFPLVWVPIWTRSCSRASDPRRAKMIADDGDAVERCPRRLPGH